MTYNKQGRTVSDSMRLNTFKKFLKTQTQPRNYAEQYRGYTIERGSGKHCFIVEWRNGAMHDSLAQARSAIDRCLAIRAELSESGDCPF